MHVFEFRYSDLYEIFREIFRGLTALMETSITITTNFIIGSRISSVNKG
ncbi:hypothetical protein DBT_2234 [Dissulfuribacter thermophilus]|uniref:Uncharacterized protein n=1 Tax=Dissulfuribacter thermophilus TaxID=1156395 RepID=A0A1B9F3M0_9BACT|nr:hypothetical protein DBT_2234 [Dissulfuribacter thermophilus]